MVTGPNGLLGQHLVAALSMADAKSILLMIDRKALGAFHIAGADILTPYNGLNTIPWSSERLII